MVATTLPAVVRVVDLPVATTVTGTELVEAVQTTAGVGVSVQLSLNQIFTSIGGIPAGGATGTILNKSSGSNYSTQFSAINTFVNIGTSLATTGSATSIVVFVANQGITSTQIANNAVGTNQVASSLGIASSLSVGGLLTVGGTATITGTTILNGGLQVTGTSQFTGSFNVAGTSAFTGTVGITGTALFTSGTFGVVGTSLFTGSHGVVGTALFTSGTFGIVGTSNITGNFSVYPSSNVGFDVNYNTGTFGVPSISSSYLRLIGANGVKPALSIQGFGANTLIDFAYAEGTLQSPVAVSADAVVGSIRSFPYNGATYNSGPLLQIATLNAQTTADASGYFKFQVIATGTTNLFESVRFQASGGVSIGTTHDPGIGRLEVNSGILVNGGTTLFTTAFGVVGTSIMTGVHGVVGTALFTGAFVLGNSTTGIVWSSGTGVITATTNIATGLVLTVFNFGNATTGTITPTPVSGNYQYLTNNGAFTIAAYTTFDYALDMLVQNGTSPGNIGFSGFRVGSVGDAISSTGRLIASAVIATGSPGIITVTAHLANVGDPIWFSTSGAVPTGMSSSTLYYVSTATVNTLQIATSPGTTTSINLSSTQSGTHTATLPTQYLLSFRSMHFVPTYIVKALQ